MSAIAGILYFGGAQVPIGTVERITAEMAISGPDGMAHWYGGSVALGHCMMRTTHEAKREVQPLENENKSIVLVMDGRLDNRDELQREFAARSLVLRSESDAELVLRAYECWGDDCPERLLGDFAFAVWDARQQRLFCTIDHMGACQLSYTQTDQFYAFASTDEALLCLPGVSAAPNEELIATLFVPEFHSYDPAASWHRHIQYLLPGQCLSLTLDGKRSFSTYWQWQPGEDAHYASEAQAQEEFLSVFGEAVRCRLRASGTLAQMMSGGLDSASIRAMIPDSLSGGSNPVYRSYSAVSDFPESCPETRCIQSLTQGLDARFVSVPSFTGMVSLEDMAHEAWSRAHPCDNSIMLPALMCLAASRDGARVMLHGASGDVTTDVPDRYPAHSMRSGQLLKAWQECQQASVNNIYLRGTSPIGLYALNTWTAFAPASIKALRHRTRRHLARLAARPIHSGLAQRLQLDERLRRQGQAAESDMGSIQNGQVRLLSGPFGPALGLGGYSRLGRRYGMEMRDPWGDKRVVEYFLRLPLAYKMHQGWTKYMVRSSLHAQLEPQILWRLGKEHLGWQLTRRLMDESRQLIIDAFRMDFGLIAQYLDPDQFQHRLSRYLNWTSNDSSQIHADRDFVYTSLVLMLRLKQQSARK